MTKRKSRITALLPMKANSERVRGKNFRDFNGKPLFQWILDSLLAVSEIDQVVINTDARAILEQHGLTSNERIVVRDRRAEICGDQVSMNLVLADDVANVESDVYLMTHTTNPLLSADTIQRAIRAFHQASACGKADSLFAVTRFQTRFYQSDATPINHDPNHLIPTQELEPWFEENSNLYCFTKESFESTGARIGKRPLLFETPRLEAIDIDTPDDWDLCLAVSKSVAGNLGSLS